MRKQTTLRRATLALFVVLVGATGFAAGGVNSYLSSDRNRTLEAFAYQVFEPPWRFVRDGIGGLSAKHADPTAMNTNRFIVSGSGSDLPGTVLFALRGNPREYEDRIVEVDRS